MVTDLTPGEYTFVCVDCKGDGNIQVASSSGLNWEACWDCHGAGTVTVDEEEAADKIFWGQAPVTRP